MFLCQKLKANVHEEQRISLRDDGVLDYINVSFCHFQKFERFTILFFDVFFLVITV